MNRYRIYLGISIISATTLAFEIALTRIFTITLWYHFAYMVVSIAMLGIAASGTFLAVRPGSVRPERLWYLACLFSLSLPLSYILSNQIPFDPAKLSWDRNQVLFIALFYLLFCLPFFLSGLIILSVFHHFAEDAGRIYFFDLLGAGAGSVAVLLILAYIDEGTAIAAISLLSMAGPLFIGHLRDRVVWYSTSAMMILLIAVLVSAPFLFDIKMSPYKGLMAALRYPGSVHLDTFRNAATRVDVIESPAVRYAPGLSLRYLEPLPPQVGLAVDGGELEAVTLAGPGQQGLEFIEYLPASLAYHMGSNRDVLIMEPKGGLHVLIADYYSSGNIEKIESNPVLVSAVRKSLNEFSGGIYNERTHAGIGRGWIKKQGLFDIIDISLTKPLPWEGGAYGLSEDFRFTKDAFLEYYRHLREDGYLTISLYILPPARTELRLLSSMAAALESDNISNADKRIAAIRSWNTITILMKKGVLSSRDIERIKGFARERRFDIAYYPGIRMEETNIFNRLPDNSYEDLISRIVNPVTRQETIDHYLFDISPTTDESPFFYHFFKIKNLRDIYNISGSKWEYLLEGGYLLPAVLLQVIFISTVVILLPLYLNKGINRSSGRMQAFFYFLGIGLGFIFVEVSAIQRFILLLDYPVYSVSIVLATILVLSGIGSLVSQRLDIREEWRGDILWVIVVLILCYALLLDEIVEMAIAWDFAYRVILSILLLAPLGFFMGFPFPSGMRLISVRGFKTMLPWAWGINGSFSVAGSILAVLLALIWGFSGVMFIAAASYGLAILSLYLPYHRDKTDAA